MTYIITEPCVGVCDTACVEVCPVDCIHGPYATDDAGAGAKELLEAGKSVDGLQLYINPEECIDCGACEPECPVEAIFEESEVPEEWASYTAKNYEHFGQTPP
ncbi:MAG: ferredoxin family protein [Fidelibacterota bacterium]